MPKLTQKALELLARVEARKTQMKNDQKRLEAIERRKQADQNELKYGGREPYVPDFGDDKDFDIGNTQDRYEAILTSTENGNCTTRSGTYFYHKTGDGRHVPRFVNTVRRAMANNIAKERSAVHGQA